jgi:hypothetical protein
MFELCRAAVVPRLCLLPPLLVDCCLFMVKDPFLDPQMSNVVALRVNLAAKKRFGAFFAPHCDFNSAQSNVHSAHMRTCHENPQRMFLFLLCDHNDEILRRDFAIRIKRYVNKSLGCTLLYHMYLLRKLMMNYSSTVSILCLRRACMTTWYTSNWQSCSLFAHNASVIACCVPPCAAAKTFPWVLGNLEFHCVFEIHIIVDVQHSSEITI